MNTRQKATILAALRYWQRQGLTLDAPELEIATDGNIEALSAVEIDELTEQLHFGAVMIASADVENATKAAQSAAFLCGDLLALLKSGNPLLSDAALVELEVANKLRLRLERLQSNLTVFF